MRGYGLWTLRDEARRLELWHMALEKRNIGSFEMVLGDQIPWSSIAGPSSWDPTACLIEPRLDRGLSVRLLTQ